MTRLLLVAALACIPAAAVAQAPNAPGPWANKLFLKDIDKNPAQPAPAVIAHDFGTVPHGTLCAHKFKITNIYEVPIQVIDVVRSCGCLEAYPPQKVLQPNESAELAVTMNTAQFNGAKTQTIQVTFGPNYVSTAVIRLSAVSRSDVQLNPGQVNFGTIPVGAKPTQVVTLEYTGKQKDWKVTGAVTPAGPIDVDVKEAPRGLLSAPATLFGSGSTKFLITVALKADAEPGPLHEVISLKTTDPAAPLVQVNVTGMVEAPLTLSTNVVRFEKVKVGETVSHKLMVRAASGPFKIKPVADEGDGVTVETFPAPAPVQIVTIKFTPEKAGPLKKELRLKTDLGGGATTVVTVEGEAVE
jgi:hypothetical protein